MDRRPVSCQNFYSGVRGKSRHWDNVENLVEIWKKHPVIDKFPTHVLGSTAIWKIFPKQYDAIECQKSQCNTDVKVFAFEDRVAVGTGRRTFLVADPVHVWFVLKQFAVGSRHGYEVIVEGIKCKLYFDLEFQKSCNTNCDGDNMVQEFTQFVMQFLKAEFTLDCSLDGVIDLDSSSDSKFSRHLVFPSVVFQNNFHVGEFVKRLSNHIKSDDSDKFLVSNNEGHKVPFFDEAVYTKNRNFRMYTCSKLGKNIPLIKYRDSKYETTDEEEFFLNSLITNVQSDQHILQYDNLVTKQQNKSNVTSVLTPSSSTPSSPYIEIDKFICGLIQPSGSIRQWLFFQDTNTIVYEIVGYRYCNNVNRWHKSNNIMFVVDLANGKYYQKCHDPDCAGYKSDGVLLPLHVLPWLQMDSDVLEMNGDVESFPEFGMSNSQFVKVVELLEKDG